ncbi:MAG: hypothetical protein AVDCRST_MAG59-174 [uncultured Thermomicrobiales bacterium]|uniref:Uncharacterized protein n=1 Tax=uncultured Thermomicrobiales bacterium TaxID=1645740 RepID=A0A6J4U0N2_9BACT|nr:MAG: hypothetical protein AVDCRST_MAG59-174 [uncultured Thermomicrobiales bacterium]
MLRMTEVAGASLRTDCPSRGSKAGQVREFLKLVKALGLRLEDEP